MQCESDGVSVDTCNASGAWANSSTCQYSCKGGACQGPACQLSADAGVIDCPLGDNCCANASNYTAACEANGADGGTCPTGGGALLCEGSKGPDGGLELGQCPSTQFCCGKITLTGGTVPNCTATSITSACSASACGDNMPSGLGPCGTGSKNARLCLSNADCTGDTNYPKCCSCGTNSAGVQNNPSISAR